MSIKIREHAAGPWRIAGHGNTAGQLPIVAADGTEVCCITKGGLADSRLVASAPDLLHALQETTGCLVSMIPSMGRLSKFELTLLENARLLVDKNRETIRKATGMSL